jgi:hypothetical protein
VENFKSGCGETIYGGRKLYLAYFQNRADEIVKVSVSFLKYEE